MRKLYLILLLLTSSVAQAAITFDGVDDRVPLTTRLTDTTSFSISVWVQIASLPSDTSGMAIFANGRGSGNGWKLGITNVNGVVRFTKYGVVDLDKDIGSFTLNTWHHIVCVVGSDKNVELYYDGVDQGNYSNTSLITANSYEILVGSDNSSSGSPLLFWNGIITELYYYNVALTAGNVATLYGSGNPVRGVGTGISGYQLYLPMNDGTSGSANGQTVADSSPNHNNGTGNYGSNATGLTWSSDASIFTVPTVYHTSTTGKGTIGRLVIN